MEDHIAENIAKLPTLSSEKVQRIVQMRHDGYLLREIAAETGVSMSLASIVARLHGIKRGIKRDLREPVAQVMAGELTVKQAAERYKVSPAQLWRSIKVYTAYKIERKKSCAALTRWVEIVKIRRTGATLEEIAREYGITRQRVLQILKKYEARTGEKVDAS